MCAVGVPGCRPAECGAVAPPRSPSRGARLAPHDVDSRAALTVVVARGRYAAETGDAQVNAIGG
jgi:hypothetical protein